MVSMNVILRLLRVEQWYKNLVVFLALFFTDNLLNLPLLERSIFGFISLCLMSSSYYILNDIEDRGKDKLHPEKKKRPIASGEVGVKTALAASAVCFLLSILTAYVLSIKFLIFPILLFISATLYNNGLKNVAFVDIHVIAVNFLIRAVGGAAAINVAASVWLVTSVFFLALLLALSKRRTELSLLGKDAVKHKEIYKIYSDKILDELILLVSAILLIAYSFYTFMAHPDGYMMLTIPFATFIVFRYLYLSAINHVAARKTQLLFTDAQILAAFILWLIASFIILYMM
ncbi:MAG TPA: decaprenyl-phosphate phosphoribosyltransferase [Candidatus Altiarchaeales archaeon]|nr:decaprenyl-phosphate phosphoribosyltransferase [Candidatus Altiarchaeales archaeon]